MQDVRWEARTTTSGTFALTWRDREGVTHSAEGRGVDVSNSGIGIECARELKPGSIVYVSARDGSIEGDCVVVHCTGRGAKFHIGLEFREETQAHSKMPSSDKPDTDVDYYEVLQISPKADNQTVHRVFKMMAARFHPDNPETGNLDEFLRLRRAYDVLSDPERRAEYDALRQTRESGTMPIFELKDFVTGLEAEANRRLGVLSLLYNQRRVDPEHPGISLLNLEERMGFPREYLNFTLWYLRAKEFVTVGDNGDYTLTAPGADYVESNASQNEIVNRLLKPGRTHGSGPRPRAAGRANGKTEDGSRGTQRGLLGAAEKAN
jgi:DnaJ domain/PilZ domain